MNKNGKNPFKIIASTSWIRDDIGKLESILSLIDGIEINSIGNMYFAENIYNYAKDKKLTISSIHASAGPHKIQDNAYYLPNIASPNRELREYDVEQLFLTAEWANKIGVDKIVLHAGSIDDESLKSLYLSYKEKFKEGSKSNDLKDLKQKIIKKRESLIKPYFTSLIKSLKKVCNDFRDIQFYLETRVNYYEIPTPDEAENIIKDVECNNIGYWNDIGHSYIQDKLGLINFEEWVHKLNKYCGGLHIHDINSSLKDHYPPGFGKANLIEILKKFPLNIPWVLEINSRHTPEELKRGIDYYKNIIRAISIYT